MPADDKNLFDPPAPGRVGGGSGGLGASNAHSQWDAPATSMLPIGILRGGSDAVSLVVRLLQANGFPVGSRGRGRFVTTARTGGRI